ncbi:hypothetical protein ACQ23P_09240 [Staphylococcus cohnii]|uniref:hypothetical protein n=1 Tax=Staphylococcus cohnii TaxID=29382 RepID=UPI003AF5FAEF
MKKVLLSTALLMTVIQLSSQEVNGEEIPHGILHKDGSFTEPNVFPHKDIAEVEKLIELKDGTKKIPHGILHKDGSFTEPNVFPHKDIAEVEEPKELEDATKEFNHKSNSETSLHNNAVNEKLKDEGVLNSKNPGGESDRFNKNQNLDISKNNDFSKFETEVKNSKNSVNHNAIKELPNTGMISDNRTLTIFLASISLIVGSLLLCKRVNFKVFQK